ncbi:uncharacterized protein LOC110847867 [Folsomia candida]|uniref:uncharacterized protein LOC110847867 n=1 Tax=Folsomia candida TaxID=158441 RepID=UPI000B8F7AFA|nr:uncharacterized protein LOC110847867 [Folsomia candida]XP_035706422.1 uncharacterized protein LOC110847867 [Folsomia candida]
MSSYSAFRLFFRLEKPGRLLSYGNVGITCTTPFLERQHQVLIAKKNELLRKSMLGVLTDGGNRFKLPAIRRHYSTAVSTGDIVKSDSARLAPKKKSKTAESPKIMLVSETKHISVVTLEEAQKIAERKTLHLVAGDSKLSKDKPVYKLVTNAEFLASDSDSSRELRQEKDDKKKEKESKTVILRSKIAENDILSKVKQMIKWIEKGHSVRLMIGQSGEKGDADHVYKVIEQNMKESGARFLQKVVKGDQIRCQLMPPKEPKKPVTTIDENE